MTKLRKTSNHKVVIVVPIILVILLAGFLTYSFANFKSIKTLDIVGGYFVGNSYTLSYNVANCNSKTIKNGKTYGELCTPAIPDDYKFDGWYNGNTLVRSSDNVRTNSNITLTAHFSPDCNQIVGKTYNFYYTGKEESFVFACHGQYKIEAWGASGGPNSLSNDYKSGYGGYAVGKVYFSYMNRIFINVGGQGNTSHIVDNGLIKGGYNGGGNSSSYNSQSMDNSYELTTGGGGTSIATATGTLSTINVNQLLMAAGGGGGLVVYKHSANYYSYGTGGSGGGASGETGTGKYWNHTYESIVGAGQTATTGLNNKQLAGSLGLGVSKSDYPGGGGGYYGGNSLYSVAGSGGSGYNGSQWVSDKHMYCYNCPQYPSSDPNTYTISEGTSSCVNANPTADCAKLGNGHVRITFLGSAPEPNYNRLVSAPVIASNVDLSNYQNDNVSVYIKTPGYSESGIDYYEYVINRTGVVPSYNQNITGTSSDGNVTISDNGINYIWLRTVDNDGEKSVWSNGLIVKIDKTLPSIDYWTETINNQKYLVVDLYDGDSGVNASSVSGLTKTNIKRDLKILIISPEDMGSAHLYDDYDYHKDLESRGYTNFKIIGKNSTYPTVAQIQADGYNVVIDNKLAWSNDASALNSYFAAGINVISDGDDTTGLDIFASVNGGTSSVGTVKPYNENNFAKRLGNVEYQETDGRGLINSFLTGSKVFYGDYIQDTGVMYPCVALYNNNGTKWIHAEELFPAKIFGYFGVALDYIANNYDYYKITNQTQFTITYSDNAGNSRTATFNIN